MRAFRFSIVAAALALNACAADEQTIELSNHAQAVGDPLLEQLQALPGVTVTELAPRPDARQFMLRVTQPVDHARPHGATFEQRVVLRSRGTALPTTLATTGYGLFGSSPRDNEVSFLLSGNAITVEHRYFEGSMPSPADPRYLTIRQSAADFHRIVELLRPIYTGAWISTGASKGGMTSVYHRRFYPNDVDATVAYVAPHSYTTDDIRYGVFLERVGTRECRQRIIETQRAFLTRRAELLSLFEAQSADFGVTYNKAGGLEFAFEHAVAEFRFAIWQNFDALAICPDLPGADAPAETLFSFLDVVAGPANLASDQVLEIFGSYYFQASTQLGSYGPLSLETHLRGRLEHPGTYRMERYSTLPLTRPDLLAMPDVQLWLATRGERIMLIYGENDPWSAGAYLLGRARDSYRYTVPGGNHGSSIVDLPDADRTAAVTTLARWAGVAAPALDAALDTATNASPGGSSRLAPDELVPDWRFDRMRRTPL